MIYLADDYVEKYQDSLGYILGRAIEHKYSFSYIENVISYSTVFKEFEESNITQIAFSSFEKIYSNLFSDDNTYSYDQYGIYSWLGYIYIQLFLELRITFELLFILLPLEDSLNMFHLYHEMDISQTINYVKNKMNPSLLHTIIEKKNIKINDLSKESGVSLSTIRSLVYGYRDLNKIELKTAEKIAKYLNVRIESLIYPLDLKLEL